MNISEIVLNFCNTELSELYPQMETATKEKPLTIIPTGCPNIKESQVKEAREKFSEDEGKVKIIYTAIFE